EATRSRIARSSSTLPGEKRPSRYMPMTSSSAIDLQESLGDGDVFGTIDVHRVADPSPVERRAMLHNQTEEFSKRSQLAPTRLADVLVHAGEEKVRSARDQAAACRLCTKRDDPRISAEPNPERLLVVDEARHSQRPRRSGGETGVCQRSECALGADRVHRGEKEWGIAWAGL